MLEKEIEAKLKKSVEEMGGRAYKLVSPGNFGMPDRMVLMPGGKMWFVELKTDTGRLSVSQCQQIRRLRSLGYEVRVAKGLKGVEEFLREVRDAL